MPVVFRLEWPKQEQEIDKLRKDSKMTAKPLKVELEALNIY
ncbi:MAG: hypothetical protein U0930_02035 [Pirellulales bacterium]